MTNDWDLAEGKAKQPQIPGFCCAHRCCWAAAALPGASFSTGGEGDDCPEPGRKDVLFLATCFLDWASRPSEHLQEGKRAAIGKVQQPHSPPGYCQHPANTQGADPSSQPCKPQRAEQTILQRPYSEN